MSKPIRALDKNRIDVAQAFLLFMATIGDCDRVAAALDLEPEQVRELAESEGWTDKIRRVSVMSKSGKPGDFERAQNRALCFVQAQTIRQQIDRLLRAITELDTEELLNRCSTTNRAGNKQLSAKVMCDLAQATEACQRMAYQALGDTVTERVDAGTTSQETKTSDLHAAIIAALSNPSLTQPAGPLLLDEVTAQLPQVVDVSAKDAERKSSEQSE